VIEVAPSRRPEMQSDSYPAGEKLKRGV
jgi:hypothetical protein